MSFETFLADMGERPKGTTIDRIDNDKGYFKQNCRWATRKAQQRNRRVNRKISTKYGYKCISEAAELYGVNAAVVRSRLFIGWEIEKALTVPLKNRVEQS